MCTEKEKKKSQYHAVYIPSRIPEAFKAIQPMQCACSY
jgi:hypothetical protein